MCAGTVATARADESEQKPQGFLEGATLNVLSRNFYLNSDYRSPSPSGKSYKAEWAQGFIGAFESGFTPGTVGFGLDSHAFLGLKLDSGKVIPALDCCRWAAMGAVRTTTPVVAAR